MLIRLRSLQTYQCGILKTGILKTGGECELFLTFWFILLHLRLFVFYHGTAVRSDALNFMVNMFNIYCVCLW